MRASITELKDHLSAYVQKVKRGEEIIITSHNKPLAKIVPLSEEPENILSREEFLNDLDELHQKLGKLKLKKSMSKTVIEMRKKERQ